jgi:formate dehydrogenase subunit gamma
MDAGRLNHEPWSEQRVRDIVERCRELRGPLLPVLHALQAELGFVDPRAVPVVADALNLSRAEVHGVVSFYADFRSERPGTAVVRVCRAEACQALGAERLALHAAERLGVKMGATAGDGSVSLDQVFCLGNCALSPAVTVNGRLYGRVDERRFDALVAEAGLTVGSAG